MRYNGFCNLPFHRAKVEWDGMVKMCCHQPLILGNLFEKSFEEIWFGAEALKIRSDITEGRLPEYCNGVACPFQYKPLKPNFAIHTSGSGYPSELEIDLHPTGCNYGGTTIDSTVCIMCPRKFNRERILASPDRTDEIISKISHLGPTLNTLCVLGLAEPFWNDQVFMIADKLKLPKQKLFFWTYSNGSVFFPEVMDKFASYFKTSSLYFSLDAATQKTYSKIRHQRLQPVLDNVRAWVDKVAVLNRQGHHHRICIANTINLLNIDEMEAMLYLSKDLGVSHVQFISTGWGCIPKDKLDYILVNPENSALFYRAEKKACRVAKEIGIDLTIARALDYGLYEQQLHNLKLP